MTKSVIITDSVRGLIQLSQIEKRVSSSPIFNRLHNVLQNSRVNSTYPSSRTSRFSHSLGVMHLAGELLYRGLLNADSRTQKRVLEDLSNELASIMEEKSYRSEVDLCAGDRFQPIEPMEERWLRR